MRTCIGYSALLLALAAPSVAFCQEATKSPLLVRVDRNGDGSIFKEEIAAVRPHIFSRLHRNGDGRIDRDEIATAQDAVMDRAEIARARLATAWRGMEKDGDGAVMKNDFQAGGILFDLADATATASFPPQRSPSSAI